MMVRDNKYGYFSLSDIPVASILRHLTVDTDCVGLDGSVYMPLLIIRIQL